MSNANELNHIIEGLKDGGIVPYIGPGVLEGVTSLDGDEQIPHNSESLILAMNDGRPMAPRLMYEFPRAAMNLELKKGRSFVERFLTTTYLEKKWQRAPFHDWLAKIKPSYVIDINRDLQLQESYNDTPHTLVVGIARVGGTDYRFKIFEFDGSAYGKEIPQSDINADLPILFKPMGTPSPEPNYIAADADYVDYITELMGGFAIPSLLKEKRKDKQYLFIGLNLTRDTERMVLSDLIYDSKDHTGWALLPNPTEKEVRFCNNKNITVINEGWQSLLGATTTDAGAAVA